MSPNLSSSPRSHLGVRSSRTTAGLTLEMFVHKSGKSASIIVLSYRDLLTETLPASYAEHHVTDAEFASLPPRLQDQVKRMSTMRGAGNNWQQYYTPASTPSRFKRYGEDALSSHLPYTTDDNLLCLIRLASRTHLLRFAQTERDLHRIEIGIQGSEYLCNGLDGMKGRRRRER